MALTGILLNDDLTLKIENGDVVLGDITAQNQKLILLCRPGELRYEPRAGVAIDDFIDDDAPGDLSIIARREFKRDSMDVQTVSFDANNLVIDAEY